MHDLANYIKKYLFIANDYWFDFAMLIADTHAHFLYWGQVPKIIKTSEHVYFYLAGSTKAVKYEFIVAAINVPATTVKTYIDFSKYYRTSLLPKRVPASPTTNYCALKLLRTISNLDATSPRNLREKAKINGSLMSNRTLNPYAIAYLDTIL